MFKQAKLSLIVFALVLLGVFAFFQLTSPQARDEPEQAPECACLWPVYATNGSGQKFDAEQFLQDINEFEKVKLICTDDKPICEFYNRLKQQVPQYRKYIADGLPKARGKRIDFVLFYHQSMGDVAQNGLDDPDAEESNRQTTLVMEQIKPDLVGAEGCYGKECNKETEWEDSQRAAKDMDLTLMTREVFERYFDAWAKLAWHQQFAKTHPTVPIVGIDDYGLHTLDGHMLADQIKHGYNGGGNPMNFLIWRIRSQIAVIRMATFLEEQGKQHGAIVMGYAHRRDFRNLATKLGISSRFYVAVSDPIRDTLEPF